MELKGGELNVTTSRQCSEDPPDPPLGPDPPPNPNPLLNPTPQGPIVGTTPRHPRKHCHRNPQLIPPERVLRAVLENL